ncbi:MAG: LytR/AlgR family response regulator transcription factor, partial [Planctomycetota bacterium]
RIRSLLEGEADFDIVAESDSGAKAVEAIESLKPDLVFQDIQMPEVDGFDVLMALEEEQMPLVVFVTAFDQYAVRAFDVHALDYLLKPFDRERFNDTLTRVREQVKAPGGTASALRELLTEVKHERMASDRLLVKSEGRIIFLSSREIDWVEAAGNYMRLHAGEETYLIRETMTGLENRLPEDLFARVHRSTIVNLDSIKEMQPAFNGEYTIILKSGKELRLSRNFRPAVEKKLGKPL